MDANTVKQDWFDVKRGRKVPVRLYLPNPGKGPYPIILFSHGLGGSRDGYSYLGRHWSECGYVAVHLQHPGTDIEVWQNVPPGEVMQALRVAAAQPGNSAARVLDVSFAIDTLTRLNAEPGPLHGKLDLGRIGVAGHSFGALTALAIAGEVFTTMQGRELFAPDPRVKAIIAMSSPVPRKREQWATAFSKIGIPCLHITGTEDAMPFGNSGPEDRRVPFDHSSGADAYLVTFTGGDHMVFVGLNRNVARAPHDASIHELVRNCSVAFFDAYLRGDAASKTWLANGGFAAQLGSDGVFEERVVKQDISL